MSLDFSLLFFLNFSLAFWGALQSMKNLFSEDTINKAVEASKRYTY